MSLLMGLGKGLQGAGQAIGQGLYAYAMAMRDDERERMRQASLEKRWAREDARYAEQQAKDEQRYQAREAKDDARYQDSVKFREQDANRANARESRQDEKQSAAMLGQALDRLDSIKKAKAKEIAEMYVDPMTKQVTDLKAYQAEMDDLNNEYKQDASKMVQQSGMSEAQINKYGFSMFLPSEPAAMPESTPKPDPASTLTPEVDIQSLANSIRQPQAQAAGNAMPKPGETKRDVAVDFLLNDRGVVNRKPGLLSPEAIAQQNEYLKRMRESGVQSAYGAAMMPR